MPKVRQLAPTWTEKESELVLKIISRELTRVAAPGFEVIDGDPFEVNAPSVRRRLVDRLHRAHEKLSAALGHTPAIATTPVTESDIITEIAT